MIGVGAVVPSHSAPITMCAGFTTPSRQRKRNGRETQRDLIKYVRILKNVPTVSDCSDTSPSSDDERVKLEEDERVKPEEDELVSSEE